MAAALRRVSSSLLVFGLVVAVTGRAVAVVVDGHRPQVRKNKIKPLPSLFISGAAECSFMTTMPSMLLVLAPDVPLLSAIVDGPPSSSLVVTAVASASQREKPLGINAVSMKKLQNISADYYYYNDAIMRPEVIGAAVLPSSSLRPVANAAVPYPSDIALPIC
jgi:hypothetical protein